MTKIRGCSSAAYPPRFVVSVTPPTIWRDFYGSDTHASAFTQYFEPSPWTVSPTLSERIVSVPATRRSILGFETPEGLFVRNIKLAQDDYVALSPELNRRDYDVGGFWHFRVFYYWEDPRADEVYPIDANPYFPNPIAGYVVVNVFEDGTPIITDTFTFGYRRAFPLVRDYELVSGDVQFTSAELRGGDEPQVGFHEGDLFVNPLDPLTLGQPAAPAFARYNFLHLYNGFSETGGGYAGNTFHFTGRELQFRFTVHYSKMSRPRFFFIAEKDAGFC